jgi:hypothetical protein
MKLQNHFKGNPKVNPVRSTCARSPEAPCGRRAYPRGDGAAADVHDIRDASEHRTGNNEEAPQNLQQRSGK